LILRRKACPIAVRLASYNFSVLGKTVENLAPQKQKITDLHYLIYTRTDAFISRKIFNFIGPKSAFLQASGPMFENPAKLCP